MFFLNRVEDPREIPRPAGEGAGLRDDAAGMGKGSFVHVVL